MNTTSTRPPARWRSTTAGRAGAACALWGAAREDEILARNRDPAFATQRNVLSCS